MASLKLIFLYLVQDMKRGPIQFKIAVITIYIIVAFMSILLNANSISISMFLGIAERQAGDTDFIITSQFANTGNQINNDTSAVSILTNLPLLNIKDVAQKLEAVEEIEGVSERWLLPGRIKNNNYTTVNLTTGAFAVIGNSLKERSIGIGRGISVQPLIDNECYLVQKTANMVKLYDNKTVSFQLDVLEFLQDSNLQSDRGIDSILDIALAGIPTELNLTQELVGEVLRNLPLDLSDSERNIFGLEIPAETAANFTDFINGIANGTLVNITAFQFNTSGIREEVRIGIKRLLDIKFDLKVKEILDSPMGKWPENLGNVVYFENTFFLTRLREHIVFELNLLKERVSLQITGAANSTVFKQLVERTITEQVSDPIINGFDQLKLSEQSLSMNAVIKDKPKVYASFNKFEGNLIQISNKMMAALEDSSRFTMTSPIMVGFRVLGFLSLLLDNMIYAILIVLAILSYILISSLMVFNIDEKNYEFGMLRALGYKRKNLVYMLLIQGSIFSIAGWTIGALTSYVVSSLLKYYFYAQLRIKIGEVMSELAWLSSIFFGFLTPIVTNFYSIRKSLGKNLKDSLDLYRRSVNELTISFMKLEKLGISSTTLFLAIEFAIYGFLFYYFAPLSFFLNRIDLFLMMLNLTLLAMVLGMTVMANQIQAYFEQFLVSVCLFFACKNRSLKVVISKNLESHQKRNHKTALMITMSVCFIIFSGSGITMNAKGLVNQLIMTQGGDLVVTQNTRRRPYAYDYEKIEGFLREYSANFTGQIKDWCWSTKSFSSFQNIGNSRLSPLSLFPDQAILVTGVDKSVMRSVRQSLYIPYEYQDGLEYETLEDGRTQDGVSSIFQDNQDQLVTESIYDPKNIISLNQLRIQPIVSVKNVKAVIPTGFSERLRIDTATPALLRVRVQNGGVVFARFNVTHVANKVPGFSFSRYFNQLLLNNDVLISLENYRNIFEDIQKEVQSSQNDAFTRRFYDSYNSTVVEKSKYKLPYNKLQIKLEEGIQEIDKDQIKNGLQTYLSEVDFILDTLDIERQTQSSLDFLTILNSMIAILTTVISFFMLLIALIKNIKDNVWELGILRSIGLDHGQIFIIYFVETFAVIFSSLILGTLVGWIISFISSIYLQIFLELPRNLYFPWIEFGILVGALSLTSFLTTFIGLKGIVYQPVAKILKGLV